ncbi:MAG: ACP S-malonyltransferase [Legionellales bacterium]|nr:ACP S-malonyltransferase [Legionellales bacterium]
MTLSSPFALVFPGQGSQSLGMLDDLYQRYDRVKEVMQEASRVLGYDVWQLISQGPEEQLNQTEYTQPIMLAADIAVFGVWQDVIAMTPAVVAGHSLGEYAALVCAGVLSFADALKIVQQRAQFMQAAVPLGEGAMAAIVGLEDEAVRKVCQQASEQGIVAPANYNALGQIVIAGASTAVDRAITLAEAQGARMAKRIAVSVPAHCPLMEKAMPQLAKALDEVVFNPAAIPIINNTDVIETSDPTVIKKALIKQIAYPVRWVETIQKMQALQLTLVIECGPGKILTKLNKRICPELEALAIGDLNSLEKFIKR